MSPSDPAPAKPAKRPWTRPAFSRIWAREGEAGGNPVRPEGIIGMGGS